MKTSILKQNTLYQARFLIKTFKSYKILQGCNICFGFFGLKLSRSPMPGSESRFFHSSTRERQGMGSSGAGGDKACRRAAEGRGHPCRARSNARFTGKGGKTTGGNLMSSAANALLGNTTKPKEILPHTAAFMQSLGFLIKKIS